MTSEHCPPESVLEGLAAMRDWVDAASSHAEYMLRAGVYESNVVSFLKQRYGNGDKNLPHTTSAEAPKGDRVRSYLAYAGLSES